jgi:hypothetical protein
MEYRDRPTPARILGISSSLIWIVLQTLIAMPATAQMRIPLQPFAQQVRQIETTLAYLGEPLPQKTSKFRKRMICVCSRSVQEWRTRLARQPHD